MILKRLTWLILLLASLVLVLAACSSSDDDSTTDGSDTDTENGEATTEDQRPSGKLVIYTGRDEAMVEGVIEKFNEKYPDIKVEFMTMGAQQILERVRGEKANPQGDFWWGGTQAAMMVAANEDLLLSWEPTFVDAIDPLHRDEQNRWFGEMLLPEVIMINSDVMSPEEGPQDWDELLDEKWKDEIVIRGVLASGTMRTIYSAMIHRQGADTPEKGYEWLAKLDANTKEYTQDPNALYLKLARQEGSISLWNLQDILLKKYTTDYTFDYIYPKSGAPILVDGVGIINNAPNAEHAKRFMEFLFDSETVVELSNEYYQIPTRTDIDPLAMPDWYKELELKEMDLDWKVMADKETEWMEYWDTNIKGKGDKYTP